MDNASENYLIYIFTLLVVYQVKHFLADFPLQGRYMLKKNNPGWEWVLPLSAHAAVHAIMTLCIVMYFRPEFWWLFLVDFCVHFGMDRFKASPMFLGRYQDTGTPSYWWTLGFDQMVHHLTHYYIIWYLVTH